MRVVEKSPWLNAKWSKEVSCNFCEARLELTLDDITVKYYNDQREGEWWDVSYTCPECRYKQTLITSEVPKKILEIRLKLQAEHAAITNDYYR